MLGALPVALATALGRRLRPKDELAIGLGSVAGLIALIAAVADRRSSQRARTVHRMVAAQRRGMARHRDFTRRTISLESRRLFRQLEALSSVHASLELKRPLPASRGFAASPDLLVELIRRIESLRPGLVVETGSGTSTVVIAAYLQRLGHGHVFALEDQQVYAESTRRELAFQGLEGVATVLHAPLVPTDAGGESLPWYDLTDLPTGTPIDLLLVDGPPGRLGPLARYPAMPVMEGRLADTVTILVDDAIREAEKQVVGRWATEYPEMTVEYVGLEKGLFVLTRQRPAVSGAAAASGSGSV